jgi:ribosomal protein S6
MESNFRIYDRILRFLTVKLSDQVDMEEIKKELEGASKTEPAPQEEVTEKPEGE